MTTNALRQGHRMPVKIPNKVYDGYSYYCYKSTVDCSYIKCRDHKQYSCNAIGKMVNGVPKLSRDHNHAKKPLLSCQHEFQKDLYNAAITRPFQSLRLIYDNLSQLYSAAAVTITWVKMQPIMQRWRQQVQPGHPLTPRNLMEYADLLQQPEWQNLKSYENGELSVQTIPVADGSFVSVIGSVNFLGLLNPTRLFMDATFKITPKKPQIYQFFTIMGLIDDTALPVCWMFMTRKSSLAYTAGLTYFKNQLAPHIQPEIIIIDFESSLEIATRLAFPLAKIVGCNFHYCQALMKKFKKYNLLQFCKEWLPGQIIMRKFMALALLPHHDILTAFNWLVENLPIDVHQIFAPFIQYFRRQWLLRVPPIRYSVHNEEYRTNNNSESSNRRNKLRFGIHPKIWTFTEKLRDLQAVTHLELLSLLSGEPVTRHPRSESLKRDEAIKNAWLLYDSNILDIPNFLAYASYFLTPTYLHENLNDMDGRTDDEEEIFEIGGIILRPMEEYLRMEVFQELNLIIQIE